VPPGPTPTKQLLLTSRGERWLQNFYEADRTLARDLASTLNLVSHNEFERANVPQALQSTSLRHPLSASEVDPPFAVKRHQIQL